MHMLAYLKDKVIFYLSEEKDIVSGHSEIASSLICLFARGNITIQNGGVLVESEIQKLREEVDSYDFN